MKFSLKNALTVAVGLAGLIIAQPVSAVVLTFDTSADLTSNWTLDVIPGDSNTQWRSGYGPSGGFPGSTGGFVHLNTWNTGNSMRYNAGSFTLNSMTVSSQLAGGGFGVTQATSAGRDFRMVLFDNAMNTLSDQIYFTDAGGAWTTINFNVANVRTIWVERRDITGVNLGTGFWPNLDNFVINEAISGVPVPATVALLGLGLLGLGATRRRKAA